MISLKTSLTPPFESPRIYIVPTRFGFIFGAMILFGLFLASQHPDRPSLIFLSLMITLFLVGMFWTHSNLARLRIAKVEVESGFVGTQAAIRISSRAEKNQGPLFSIQLFNRLIEVPEGTLKTEFLSIPLSTRGLLFLREFKISTTYPFGMFYAWRYWEGEAPHYAYPSLLALSEDFHPKSEPADAPETDQAFSSIRPRGPLAEDSMVHKEFLAPSRRIDWKLYARSGLLRKKEFEEAESDPVILSYATAPGNSVDERLSYLSSALYLLHKHDRPFQLELNPGEVSTHYELSLQRLATFESA